mmetsp:Transcript_10246/g.20072  ORF Transcript_10246/g.20072 Transcript_10246/m.20072 type:complete len:302 (+) Transcript_10246:464-1369(+)|eukprot:CAMPEP_0171571444 /NCGR_PEP_ID=MMETSP0961-20121227/3510_1 /TAXON_ID=87120 /ORGANISM="Aurantiochytrium limacinum, Strain ATCCMYA-1381" /LENGTH=301 /DNA_ID=CAMNT_0012126059 /DNA_START=380 /DNA_END=1285 /DNA_ORIENTATION=-
MVHKVARELASTLFPRLERGLAGRVSEMRAWEEARLLADYLHETGHTSDRDVGEVLRRRIELDEPVAYITSKAFFWTLDLRVSRDVLIPRPCSEVLVDTAVSHLRQTTGSTNCETSSNAIVDLGTGSGCLLLATLSECRRAVGVGVDVSKGALAVAKDNARTNKLSDRTRFLLHDFTQDSLADSLLEAITPHHPAQVLLSNPPYIRQAEIQDLAPAVKKFEPHLALVGGEDGLDCYRAIARQVDPLLEVGILDKGSALILEAGDTQAADIADIMKGQVPASTIDIIKDLAGFDRCVKVTLK